MTVPFESVTAIEALMSPLPLPEHDPLLAPFLGRLEESSFAESLPEMPACTRRQALRLLAVGSVSTYFLLGRNRKAEAVAPLLAILAPIFAGAVTQLITKAFDAGTSRQFRPIQPGRVAMRRLGDSFHERHAAPVRLLDRLPSRQSRYGYHLRFNDVPEARHLARDHGWQDFNIPEMRRVTLNPVIRHFGGVLYPAGFRQAPTRPYDQDRFESLARQVRNLDARLYRLEYTRTFRNERNQNYLGLGVRNRNNANDQQMFIAL